jgi:hypothetical protein
MQYLTQLAILVDPTPSITTFGTKSCKLTHVWDWISSFDPLWISASHSVTARKLCPFAETDPVDLPASFVSLD